MKNIGLSNGVQIPSIGFGTYKAAESGYEVIAEAIRAGYRHLDTAWLYGNEKEVGRAVKESGLPREAFFITSKLDRDHLGYENAKAQFRETLENLGMDYLDLYLIHWPRPFYGHTGWDDWKELDRDSWKALEELYKEGKIRAIGVSNFLVHHLENLMDSARIAPMVNQLELHPGYLQKETVDFCKAHHIAVEAWSPIGRGRLFHDPLLMKIAGDHGISTAAVSLAFDLAMGYIILPKSTHKERMIENLHADKIHLTDEEIKAISAMAETGWSGEHPDRPDVR
ncbi:aldo/keto reductase [Dialister sp.]|uniref:aldo/keto reductase n=1 Tax=Dialister sp. TaxID=1955814 RepID=UPI003EFCE90A